jgi:hypothetical protein
MPDMNVNRAAANAKQNPVDDAIALIERARFLWTHSRGSPA